MSLFAPTMVTAQERAARVTEANTPRLQRDCRAAAATIRAQGPAPSNAGHLRALGECRESAGAVLPDAWDAADADSVVLQSLGDASRRIRDARIEGVLMRIAADEKRPVAVRQAALVVLASYVDPSWRGVVERSPIDASAFEVTSIRMSHSPQEDGAVPLEGSARDRIIGLLARLESSDRANRVGTLARYLRSAVDKAK